MPTAQFSESRAPLLPMEVSKNIKSQGFIFGITPNHIPYKGIKPKP